MSLKGAAGTVVDTTEYHCLFCPWHSSHMTEWVVRLRAQWYTGYEREREDHRTYLFPQSNEWKICFLFIFIFHKTIGHNHNEARAFPQVTWSLSSLRVGKARHQINTPGPAKPPKSHEDETELNRWRVPIVKDNISDTGSGGREEQHVAARKTLKRLYVVHTWVLASNIPQVLFTGTLHSIFWIEIGAIMTIDACCGDSPPARL